jgi:hypothetical protein
MGNRLKFCLKAKLQFTFFTPGSDDSNYSGNKYRILLYWGFWGQYFWKELIRRRPDSNR